MSETQRDIRISSNRESTNSGAPGGKTPCTNQQISQIEDQELNEGIMEDHAEKEEKDSTLIRATFSLPLSFSCDQGISKLGSECKTKKFINNTQHGIDFKNLDIENRGAIKQQQDQTWDPKVVLVAPGQKLEKQIWG